MPAACQFAPFGGAPPDEAQTRDDTGSATGRGPHLIAGLSFPTPAPPRTRPLPRSEWTPADLVVFPGPETAPPVP